MIRIIAAHSTVLCDFLHFFFVFILMDRNSMENEIAASAIVYWYFSFLYIFSAFFICRGYIMFGWLAPFARCQFHLFIFFCFRGLRSHIHVNYLICSYFHCWRHRFYANRLLLMIPKSKMYQFQLNFRSVFLHLSYHLRVSLVAVCWCLNLAEPHNIDSNNTNRIKWNHLRISQSDLILRLLICFSIHF